MQSISQVPEKYLCKVIDCLGPGFISPKELQIMAKKCKAQTPEDCAEGIKAYRKRRAKEESKNNT